MGCWEGSAIFPQDKGVEEIDQPFDACVAQALVLALRAQRSFVHLNKMLPKLSNFVERLCRTHPYGPH